MTTALATRPTHVTDRAGFALFISWPAADAWLTVPDRGLQCPGCGDVYCHAHSAFDCCDARSAYPVVAYAWDPQLVRNVTAAELLGA